MWFNNNSPRKASKTPVIKLVVGKEKRDAIPSETQLYAKERYASIKEEADLQASKVDLKYQLSERNRVIAAKFKNESEEVKMEIRRKREEMIKERDETMAAMQALFSDGGERERSPEEYLRSVAFIFRSVVNVLIAVQDDP